MKKTKQLNHLALGLMIVFYFLLLAGNRLHIIPANINMVALFSFILIAITIIFGFIIVPADEKRLFLPKGIGYGWTPNPRNRIGFLIYLGLLTLTAMALF
ncbi:hypothetical protein [Enterococcus sp. AZ163]|uniref:hypothetical protein n=1 Tax=Enterococcus sp. AZ163 TaxID=2774638 RepID=UPI003D2AC83F